MLGLFAHALHLLLVLLGLAGVAVLMFPQVQAARSRRTTFRPPANATEHEHRVASLRAAVQSGHLTSSSESTTTTAWGTAARDFSTWRALAVSSSVAAAGVHAAVFPHHLEEAFAVGASFLAMTLGQAAWACLVSLDATHDRLVAGIVGNLGLVGLWGVSRTVGLPGLGREAVGGWDLAAVAWELVIVAACLVGLRRRAEERALVLGGLGREGWTWAALCGVTLVVLTLTVAQH